MKTLFTTLQHMLSGLLEGTWCALPVEQEYAYVAKSDFRINPDIKASLFSDGHAK